VVADPMKDVPAGLYFNPNAFAPPVLGSTITTPVLGNLGGGLLPRLKLLLGGEHVEAMGRRDAPLERPREAEHRQLDKFHLD
jgi:hypothetical protein